MATTTLGIVNDMPTAKKIIHALQSAGYTRDEISVLVKENAAAGLSTQKKHPVSKAVTTGAVAGGIIGAIGGLLTGFGAVAVPGIGPLLAGGPLLGMLGVTGATATTATGAAAGVVAGGAAGGIISALMNLGVSRERAAEYEQRLKEGAVLIGVDTGRIGSNVADQVFLAHGVTLVTAAAF